MDEVLEKIKEAMNRRDKDLYSRQLLTTDKPIGKVIASNVSDSVGRRIAEGLGYNCRCAMDPLWTPRHSGRYPWKDDDNEIREVFNMDSNRLNRFVTMLNAVGGSFRIEDSVNTRPTAHIDIPCDMLSHLHIDGDGSIDMPGTVTVPKIPAIRNIQTFNDRAVQITFADGTQTKCVCGKDEYFDLYEGIAFCLFKRFLGKNGHKGFNDLMRYAFRKLDEQEKQKVKLQKLEEFTKSQAEKARKQREKRKAKKREEKIGIFVDALRKNREIMMEEGWGPMVKPDEPNPYIAPGEPEPPAEPVKKIDDGSELFFEPLSDRTFTSSQGDILLAVMRLNNQIIDHNWVSVNEWYEELGLDSTGGLGESMGWNLDHMLNIDFASDITSDGRECLTIVYAERPVRFEEGKA
jgi:hypothetical protein